MQMKRLLLLALSIQIVGLAAAQNNVPRNSAWYVEVGVGLGGTTLIKQSGHNRDTTCYPLEVCVGQEGFRWTYDIASDPSAAIAVSIGRAWNQFSLELSGAHQTRDLTQTFTGITYLDGSARTPGYVVSVQRYVRSKRGRSHNALAISQPLL